MTQTDEARKGLSSANPTERGSKTSVSSRETVECFSIGRAGRWWIEKADVWMEGWQIEEREKSKEKDNGSCPRQQQ